MEDDKAYFVLDLESNTISATLHGRKSVIRKELIDIGEDADIQRYLDLNSIETDWSVSKFTIEGKKAKDIWKTFIRNGWSG